MSYGIKSEVVGRSSLSSRPVGVRRGNKIGRPTMQKHGDETSRLPATGQQRPGLSFLLGKHKEEHPATDESEAHRHRDFLRFLHRHRQGFIPNADELLISVVGKLLITK